MPVTSFNFRSNTVDAWWGKIISPLVKLSFFFFFFPQKTFALNECSVTVIYYGVMIIIAVFYSQTSWLRPFYVLFVQLCVCACVCLTIWVDVYREKEKAYSKSSVVLVRMLSNCSFSTWCAVTDFCVLRKHDAQLDCGTDQNPGICNGFSHLCAFVAWSWASRQSSLLMKRPYLIIFIAGEAKPCRSWK